MKSQAKERRRRRQRRHTRIRKKIQGSAERPRLVVFRSLQNMEGQLVDDDRGTTIVGISTCAGLSGDADGREGKVAAAWLAGRTLAERATEKEVNEVVFDRAGYPYHGRVRAFAEGARAGGLRF